MPILYLVEWTEHDEWLGPLITYLYHRSENAALDYCEERAPNGGKKVPRYYESYRKPKTVIATQELYDLVTEKGGVIHVSEISLIHENPHKK